MSICLYLMSSPNTLTANSSASFKFVSFSLYSCFSMLTAAYNLIQVLINTHVELDLSECKIPFNPGLHLETKIICYFKISSLFGCKITTADEHLLHYCYLYMFPSNRHNYHLDHSDITEIHSVCPSPYKVAKLQKVFSLKASLRISGSFLRFILLSNKIIYFHQKAGMILVNW